MEDDFEVFWVNYPTDKNMPKKLARKEWLLISTEQRKKAIDAIPAFKRYCADNKNWYRPIYAHRFLKEERYEGFASSPAPSSEAIAAAKDRADRLLRRGKYDPQLQATAGSGSPK